MLRELAEPEVVVHAEGMKPSSKSRIQRAIATRAFPFPRPANGLRIPNPRAILDWLCAGRADYAAFQERKRTPLYRARKRLCKNIWIGAGLLMLLHPTLPVIGALGLLATLLSFTILDEADHD